MRFLVVCGFDVTIAIFCPTRRLTSVDFPVFGRPTMATNPERKTRFFLAFSFSGMVLSTSWLAAEAARSVIPNPRAHTKNCRWVRDLLFGLREPDCGY